MRLQEPSPDMVVDIVDSLNRPVGTRRRRDIFRSDGGFRTVHVFVFDSHGRLLLQQQSRDRSRSPLTWGSSVAAYLFAGESYEAAARRRIQQELGVTVARLTLQGIVKVDDLGHDKFVGLISCIANGPFHYDRRHIERLEFTDLAEIEVHRQLGDLAFTPTFIALWDMFRNNREQSGSQSS